MPNYTDTLFLLPIHLIMPIALHFLPLIPLRVAHLLLKVLQISLHSPSHLSLESQLVSESSALFANIFPPPPLSLSLFFADEVVVLYQSSQWITHPFLLKVISATRKADKLCVCLSCDSETEVEADVLSDRSMR